MSTQPWSHESEQQVGSIEQAWKQQLSLLQKGPAWTSVQLPAPGLPQVGQSTEADWAHDWSHSVWQHVGCTAQTRSQHDASLQKGRAWKNWQGGRNGAPQKASEHQYVAFLTQEKSHENSQQPGSTRHTKAQHSGSLQEGVW
jgi:hypothetical protein